MKFRLTDTQTFSLVGYANLPQNLREFFKVKKAERPTETNSIEYLKFDKSTHPSTYKYAKNIKLRKIESNIKNLYDISMNSLLTAAEITKRSEVLAKLYMKYNYDEKTFGQTLEEEEKKNNQKKFEKLIPRANARTRENPLPCIKYFQIINFLASRSRENSTLSQDSNDSNNSKSLSEPLKPPTAILLPPNLSLKPPTLLPPKLNLTAIKP